MNQTPYQCSLVKAWNVVAPLMPGRGMAPLLSDVALMDAARKTSGDMDFEYTDFQEGLSRFIASLIEEQDLHPFGQFYVKQFVTGLLASRLKLEAHWRRHPEILAQTVPKPLFIMGLPRTGTSFLFNLLAQDPAHRSLTNWETTVSPVPPDGDFSFDADPRRKHGRYLMRFQNYLAPHMKEIHEFHLDGPEECTPLLLQAFTNRALAYLFNVPAYSRWLNSASHTGTYAQHKRILQTLQWKYSRDRWLLKSPNHIAIEDILAVYPDACIIQMHRDPVKSVPSYASLSAAFRGIHSKSINPQGLGKQVMTMLADDFDYYMAQRESCNAGRFVDFQYRDLIRDPVDTVQRAYRHFDLPFTADAEACMKAFLAKDRAKKRAHHYRPEDFGLTAEDIQGRFKGYIGRFKILNEQ